MFFTSIQYQASSIRFTMSRLSPLTTYGCSAMSYEPIPVLTVCPVLCKYHIFLAYLVLNIFS